jgi:hypothetical protein
MPLCCLFIIFAILMLLKRVLLILKISLLLVLFGVGSFYLQCGNFKKTYSLVSSEDQSPAEGSDDLPLSEEETEKSFPEEEEQDDDRTIHHLFVESDLNRQCIIALSTIHLFDFKEIHFEIITPPPEV